MALRIESVVRRRALIGIAFVAAAAACSSSSSGGGTTITTGTYQRESSQASPDTCGFGDYYKGIPALNITIAGTQLTEDFGSGSLFVYTITGSTILDALDSTTDTLDFGSASFESAIGLIDTYDCQVVATTNFPGEILGHNRVEFDDDYRYSSTGAQCAVAVTSANNVGVVSLPTTFPCESKVTGVYKK